MPDADLLTHLKTSGLALYTRQPWEDSLLLAWWERLYTDGELDTTFTTQMLSISAFFDFFHPPRALIYHAADQEIRLAFWLEPCMSGAFVGTWVHPDARHAKSSFYRLGICYAVAFSSHPVLLGVTRQEHLLREHTRLGYTVLGKIDQIYDGHAAWLLTYTRESFQRSPFTKGVNTWAEWESQTNFQISSAR